MAPSSYTYGGCPTASSNYFAVGGETVGGNVCRINGAAPSKLFVGARLSLERIKLFFILIEPTQVSFSHF